MVEQSPLLVSVGTSDPWFASASNKDHICLVGHVYLRVGDKNAVDIITEYDCQSEADMRRVMYLKPSHGSHRSDDWRASPVSGKKT